MMNSSFVSRRDSLVFGSLAAWGIASGSVGASRGMAGETPTLEPSGGRGFGRAKRCVLVWLDGGPSHLEMFDPKPEASSEVRGPLGVVGTKHAGIVFGEGLPLLAQRTDKFSVIRSMTSPVGEHNLATQYALSGHIPGGRAAAPAFMLPVAAGFGSDSEARKAISLPAHIAVPNFQLGGGSKLAGYLGSQALPWSLGTEPTDAEFQTKVWRGGSGFDLRRLERRRQLTMDASNAPGLQDALQLLASTESKQVFDLARETQATRRRYGNKPVGQNCLLARRLLEAGVPIVTVNNKGWDTHDRLHERLHAGYTGAKVPVGLIPSLDQAVAALLDDLTASGLIDDTLVVVMGEFGRTPKINTQGGRDHWARAYSVMMAGGGVAPGMIYGSSDRVGENADEQPVTPSDLVATLYHLLGVDPHERQATPDGQQMSRVPEAASVVSGILA